MDTADFQYHLITTLPMSRLLKIYHNIDAFYHEELLWYTNISKIVDHKPADYTWKRTGIELALDLLRYMPVITLSQEIVGSIWVHKADTLDDIIGKMPSVLAEKALYLGSLVEIDKEHVNMAVDKKGTIVCESEGRYEVADIWSELKYIVVFDESELIM